MALLGSHLARNDHIITFPPAALHLLPPSTHHTTVCLAMNHFIYSLPANIAKQIAERNWSKVHHHRGAAIVELNRSISNEKTRCSDGTITSIVMLLSVEVSLNFLLREIATNVRPIASRTLITHELARAFTRTETHV
jgi:hypothetical protein